MLGQNESETLIDKARKALEDVTVESAKDVMKKLIALAWSSTAGGIVG